jgi:hypothetical protein
VKLTTHLYLVLRSIISGAISPLLQLAFMAWCSVKTWGQLYLREIKEYRFKNDNSTADLQEMGFETVDCIEVF